MRTRAHGTRRRGRIDLALASLGTIVACSPSPPPRHAPATHAVPPSTPPPPITIEYRERPEKCFWEANDERRAAETPADRVRRLADVADMPYICADLCVGEAGCGEAAYWAVVRDGLDALPLLVELLEDASPTRAVVPNFGGTYAVADVALEAIEEIVHRIPTFELVGVTFDPECGGCAWWRFVRASPANRARVKRAVGAWLKNAKPKLERSSSNQFGNLDCVDHCTHPAGGYYELPSTAVGQ